jgi:hypothetical protein
MQLQDAFSIQDIHWFRYSQKNWTVSIKQIYFFTRPIDATNAEDLYQYVERTFPDHAVDLVYEAGCCGFSRHDIFKLGLNVLVVNPSDVKEVIKTLSKKQMH